MITLNKKQFAETPKEFNDDCVGWAKRYKRRIELFNRDKELIGSINKWGLLCKASKLPDGKWWYNLADIPEVGEYGSYAESIEEPRSYAVTRTWEGGELSCEFK